MQRILSFLRNHQIALAILIFVIAAGVLFSFLHAHLNAPPEAATMLQPAIERDELLDGSDLATQVEAQDRAAREPASGQAVAAPAAAGIVVYVTGAVRAPDVYALSAEARVKDVIMAAGGLADDADSEHINLAEHLKDAEHVHVPHLGEAPDAALPDAPRGTNVATTGEATDSAININTASIAELDTLPGIGPAFAQRIVDYRMEHGPFATINDLTNVQGIGPTLLEKLAPKITAGTP